MSIISVKEVSKNYGQKVVLDKVTFGIEKGEIFGLLGSNGAGKSTLTSIILGLQRPTKGSVVFFDGKTAGNIGKKVSLVPQEPAFYQDFSVEKNMRFFASIYGLKHKQIAPRVKFLLEWLELSAFKDAKAEFLSGGYQRLLNIAIALLHDPEIIFMDEPTVGLDPKMRKMFWKKIKELQSSQKTIIMTTHYMDEAEHLCTRVALMKNGKLLSIGKPRELILQHGGIKVMIFDIVNGISPDDLEKIKDALKQKSVVAKGNLLFIPFEQEHSLEKVIAITDWLMKKGYSITSSTTKEPNLEDVFLNITGEKMEEKK
jgi:ABC-2 type transport system ATP-binding protein